MRSVGPAALLWLLVVTASAGAVTAPQPTLQLAPATSSISAQGAVTVYVTIANPSAVPLAAPRLGIRSDALDLTGTVVLGAEIPPYSTVVTELPLRAKDNMFGTHAVIVPFEYQWADGAVVRSSAVVGTTSVTIKQPFEDEAKGFPGGTVALLYLLLPVIPAFLAYQLVEQGRTHQPVAVPVFRAEHIPFAFFVAVTVGVVRLMAGGQQPDRLTQSRGLITIVLWSAFIGALVPAWLWAAQIVSNLRWELRPNDDLKSYARKALLGPGRTASPLWVTGTAGTGAYAGLRIVQPDGRHVLGARLQVSPADPDGAVAARVWKTLLDAIDTSGSVQDSRTLLKLIRNGTVTLRYLKKVTLQAQERATPVVAEPLEGVRAGEASEPLIVPVA